jgi:hypothetical protein
VRLRAATVACALACSWGAPASAEQEEHKAPDVFHDGEQTCKVDEADLPAKVDEIRVEGLVRTKEFVVRRELFFAEGDVVTRAMFDLALTRLWNTTIFAHVDGEILRSCDGDRVIAVLRVEDRWTLNPLFSFGSGGNATFFRVGASDNNLLGHYLELQAQYENFDGFHGGQAIFRDPRLFDRRVELLVQVDRLVRPRRGFSDQRTQAILEVAELALSDRLRFGARVSAFANRFLQPLDSPTYFPASTETIAIEPTLRVGRVDTVRIRQRGTSLELRPSVGRVFGSDVATEYAAFTAQLLTFAMAGERWNFAARARVSGTTRVPEHLQLYAGGLDLLRGFPDNYVRTQSFWLGNAEVRFTAFDSTWIALVPVAFADAVAARGPKGDVGGALAVGGGLRILVPKFVGTGLRVDFAVPVAGNLRDVGEGEMGRFGPTTPAPKTGTVQPSFGVFQFF